MLSVDGPHFEKQGSTPQRVYNTNTSASLSHKDILQVLSGTETCSSVTCLPEHISQAKGVEALQK